MKALSPILLTLTILIAGCGSPLHDLEKGNDQQRAKAAELLLKMCKEGKLERYDAERIAGVLIPRFRDISERLRKSRPAPYSASEVGLAYELVRQGLTSDTEAVDLLSDLDNTWCQYISREPSRLEVHGDLVLMPAGTAICHALTVSAVDGKPCEQELPESFIGADRTVGLTWGYDKMLNLPSTPAFTLSVEMTTTWYSVPPDLVKQLPVHPKKPEDIAESKRIVSSPSAKKLCTYTRTAVLKESEEWTGYFRETREGGGM